MTNQGKSRGFSLVELSVAIVVAGFVLYAAFAIFSERSAIDKVAVTESRLDKIERGLRIYYEQNTSLPCPADGTLALSDADFATADCANDNFGFIDPIGGSIPTRTLNLPDSYAFDGWGKRFTYYISLNATASPIGTGSISINDAPPLPPVTTPNPITTSAVYVLISHGENGIGAWNRNGSATRVERTATTSDYEQDNAHVTTGGGYEAVDNVFTDTPINDTENVTDANYFDDIVRWKTKEMIDYDADRLP